MLPPNGSSSLADLSHQGSVHIVFFSVLMHKNRIQLIFFDTGVNYIPSIGTVRLE